MTNRGVLINQSENRMKEIALLESKELRNQAVNRIEVLEKVKKLFLIPKMGVMTIKQVAEYYEVDQHTIFVVYDRNKKEIDSDGVSIKSYKDFLMSQDVILESKVKGKVVIRINDTTTLEIPNRGIRVFPQRAILRIGMLLRDSVVAKEVRTQLLNTFDEATPEQRTKSIDDELERLYNKVDSLDSKVDLLDSTVRQMIDNTTINSRQAQKLLFTAKDRVNSLLGGAHSADYKANSRVYFKNLWLNLCEAFEVGSYKDLNPVHMPAALEYIRSWRFIQG